MSEAAYGRCAGIHDGKLAIEYRACNEISKNTLAFMDPNVVSGMYYRVDVVNRGR